MAAGVIYGVDKDGKVDGRDRSDFEIVTTAGKSVFTITTSRSMGSLEKGSKTKVTGLQGYGAAAVVTKVWGPAKFDVKV